MKKIVMVALVASMALTLAALTFSPAAAGQGGPPEDQTRPFIVYSDDPGLQASLPVRHIFEGKFTANLTLGQAHALGLQGIRVELVKVYHITAPPDKECEPWPECKNGGGGDGEVGRKAYPADQIPWGIEMIYYGEPEDTPLDPDPNSSSFNPPSGGAGIKVAVLDTGVNIDHLDLKGRVASPVDCVDFTVHGFLNMPLTEVGSCDDKNGHGTYVAGIILADGGSDEAGIYGVAPKASLMAYKVCGAGGRCFGDDIGAAIRYAANHGADIISMSLGGPDPIMEGPINDVTDGTSSRYPLVLVVASAGNSGPDDNTILYPAANPNVIAVGAVDIYKQVPDWSSRGVNDGDCLVEEREVEFAAPGVDVESTWKNGGYASRSGTSASAPHVSGLAAKLWAEDPFATADDIRALLQSLAIDITGTELGVADGPDLATGFGLPIADSDPEISRTCEW